MAKKRIIDLPNLTSGSVNTILVGHDNGTTYQIKLNVLTASVVEMLSQSTDARLDFLEEFQSDFYLISASIDTKIAAATNEQSLAHLVTTSSFNSFTQSYTTDSASFSSRIDAATNEQSLAHLATTGSNTFVGNQKITGSVSILIPGGTAYAMNENPTPNNEFWAYVVQYPDAQNVAVGWTASILGGSTYTVTAVNYQHPFNKITLSDGSLQMSYRIGINFSKSSKLWEFNSNGTLTGLPDGLISGSSQLTSSYDERYVLSGSITQTTWDNIANKPEGIVSQSVDIADFTFTSQTITNGAITLHATDADIVLNADGDVYLGSVNSGNGIVTDGYLENIIGDTSMINTGTGHSITDNLNNIINNIGIVSSSQQISDFGFVTGSYAYLTEFNSLTQSFNIISGSVVNIASGFDTASYQSFTQSYYTDSASFNSRIISGSVVTGTISSSAQISAFGFISGSYVSSSQTASMVAGFAGQVAVVTTATTTDSTLYPVFTINSASNGYNSLRNHPSGTFYYDGVTQKLYANSFVGTIEANNSVISGSSQISALGYATTSSVATISASAWGAFQSASSYSSSLQTSITTLSSSIDSRLDTLEATIISGSPNYLQVLGNQRSGISVDGTAIISGSITTTGNPVQIMVTGDANPTSTTGQWCRLQLYRNSSAIGNIIQVESSAQNENVPYCLNIIDTPSAGTYEYSLKITSPQGTWAFGESAGPLLTAVELNTNTNLPSTNNTFTGTNRFNGQVTIGGTGGDEGGELQLVTAQTNTTLTGSYASVDIYRDRLRIFEGGGTFRGVHVDLSKAPSGVSGELIWKTSGFVDAGTFVSLDNIKCTVTTSGNRGLSLGAVSTSYTANISGQYTVSGGTGGGTANNGTYTTTASTSLYNWHFPTEGDGSQYQIVDKTNNRVYRVSLMIGSGYNNNFISIERLY